MIPEKHNGQADAGILFGVLGILLLAVFPLSVHDYTSITRYKFLQMLLLTGVCGFTAAIHVRSWKDGFRWKELSRFLCAAYAVWVILSAFFGSCASMRNSSGERIVLLGAVRYEGLVTQICYCVLFLIFSLHAPRRTMIFHACSVAVMVYVFLVLCQYAGWNVLDLFPRGRSIRTNYEFQGTIGNIDMVSGYLTLMIPLMMTGFVLGEGGALLLVSSLTGVLLEAMMEVQSGLLALAVLCAVLASLALVRSDLRKRSSLALAGVCLCFALRRSIGLPWLDGTGSLCLAWNIKALPWLLGAVFIFCAGRVLSGKRFGMLRMRTLVFIWVVLLTVLFLLIYFLPLEEGSGMLWEVHEILHGRSSDSFGSWRWGVWKQTLEVSRGHLWFGTGPDLFYYAMNDHLEQTGTVLGENFDNPHNLYLAILAGSGLPALMLYLAFLVSLLIRCFRSRNPFQVSLGMSVLLYSIQGFFSFSICLVSPMAWTVLGMAGAGAEKEQEVKYDLCG